MGLKVKVFYDSSESSLEKTINEFLGKMNEGNIIDIKYSAAGASGSNGYGGTEFIALFSALIYYKE